MGVGGRIVDGVHPRLVNYGTGGVGVQEVFEENESPILGSKTGVHRPQNTRVEESERFEWRRDVGRWVISTVSYTGRDAVTGDSGEVCKCASERREMLREGKVLRQTTLFR